MSDGGALAPPSFRHLRPTTQASRVVVLGARGFIGQALVDDLSASGIPVLALSSSECNLTQPASVDFLASRLEPDDALVFASAITPDRGRGAAAFIRNVTMGYHVVAALERRPCAHVVYLSSDAVYGHAIVEPITEHAPSDPDDLYGLSHRTRERLLQISLSKPETPLAILRLSIVYGARDTHASYGPNRFMREIEKTGGLTLFSGGEELRDHVYVDDVVSVIAGVLARRSVGFANVATGRSISFYRVAQIFDDVMGRPVPRTTLPRLVPLIHRHFDVTVLRDAFPELVWRSVEDGVARVVARRKAMSAEAPHLSGGIE